MLVTACSCGKHSTNPTTTVIVNLLRGNEMVAGRISVSLTNGVIAASGHVNHTDMPVQLRGGKTYTLEATTDDGQRCGPTTVTVQKQSRHKIGPGPQLAILRCPQQP
jgi:hypothetical protein